MTPMVDSQAPDPGLFMRLGNKLAREISLAPRLTLDRPMVSFTFDDVPISAATRGAEILEEHGARGTYYVAGSYIGTRTEYYQIVRGNDVIDLHARGHEIGCHSYSHMRVDQGGGNALVTDLLRNRAALKAIEPALPIQNFAYPYGYSSLRWKRKLQSLFHTSRTAFSGVNTGQADPHYLYSTPLIDGRTGADGIERALDNAQSGKGWLIFFGHDVDTQCSPFGCPPQLLQQAARAVERRGIPIVTVEAGWEAVRPRPEPKLGGAAHAL